MYRHLSDLPDLGLDAARSSPRRLARASLHAAGIAALSVLIGLSSYLAFSLVQG
jgi:hypothetical protein